MSFLPGEVAELLLEAEELAVVPTQVDLVDSLTRELLRATKARAIVPDWMCVTAPVPVSSGAGEAGEWCSGGWVESAASRAGSG